MSGFRLVLPVARCVACDYAQPCSQPGTNGTKSMPLCDNHYEIVIGELRVKLIADKDEWFEQYQRDFDERVVLLAVRKPRRGERVYFIQSPSTGLIKIGFSLLVRSRLRTLQTAAGEPLELLGTEPGGFAREAELHKRFAHLRASGEWFRPEPELLDYIQSERKP